MGMMTSGPHKGRRLGTHPDVPDQRDRVFLPKLRTTPKAVDLRAECPPVYDQGSLNSCCANAIGAAIWFEERRVSDRRPSPSRLFLYYNERAYERVVPKNVPVSIRDAYKVAAKQGVCPETMWPYRIRGYARRPTRPCFEAARATRVTSYYRLHRDLDHLRTCLAEGHPFALGVSVYPSFQSAQVTRTGDVPLPARHERMIGGHAMLIVGYSNARRRFIVRNSWGTAWGEQGYGHLPYDYVMDHNLAWDFWTCRTVGK
jgi:C1A family cysteine protease